MRRGEEARFTISAGRSSAYVSCFEHENFGLASIVFCVLCEILISMFTSDGGNHMKFYTF